MAYNEEKFTKLKALKQLAERITQDYATKQSLNDLSTKVDDLTAAVPKKVSDLTNDSKFQTEEQVAAAVAAADHLQRKKVDSTDAIDPAAEGADKYIYMVPKANAKGGDKYDEYMVLDGVVEKVGDWAVDLSGYVQKEDGKGLSANDYTGEDKEKLAGIAVGATKVEASETAGAIKINGADVTVVDIATDTEVTEMLTEVFGAAE